MGARTRVERRKGSSGGAGGGTGGGGTGGGGWSIWGVVVVGPQYSGISVDSNEVGESTGK